MSFVADQIRRIDGHLDRLAANHFPTSPPPESSSVQTTSATTTVSSSRHTISKQSVPRILELQHLIKTLSTTSTTSHDLISASALIRTLASSNLTATGSAVSVDSTPSDGSGGVHELLVVDEDVQQTYEYQLEWLLLCKATAQTYGQVLNTILQQTLELNNHMWYWDEVLGSDRWLGVYSLQTSPLRLWSWTQGLIRDVRSKNPTAGLADGWRQFYGLVREAVEERSVKTIRARAVSPLAQIQNEARRKQKELRRLKEVNSNALGVLLGEGLSSIEDAVYNSESAVETNALLVPERRDGVAKSIVLMEAVISQIEDPDIDVDSFEERASASTSNDMWFTSLGNGYSAGDLRPLEVSNRLQSLLTTVLPQHTVSFTRRLENFGRPSLLLRYWLPATILVLSSGTLLRIAVNRKAEIITWIEDFGSTVRDFWTNWVVEPTRKVIGTIRHDKDSEVAIMSKRSLEGDRDSLERMVVDFVKDHPEDGPLNEAQVADVKSKIREGDLTPVLKAYERDMQKPVMGALRGNLIRALLIQVQKTKVDVEVAMGGIDALLKSQELVFGFVGLTPGLLVTISSLRWVNSTFINRKGNSLNHKKSRLLGVLRNIDRLLTAARPSQDGVLYYKDYGLLVCEAHVLREVAKKTFPAKEFREFLIDLEELTDMQIGLERQLKVVKRIRWGYARWF